MIGDHGRKASLFALTASHIFRTPPRGDDYVTAQPETLYGADDLTHLEGLDAVSHGAAPGCRRWQDAGRDRGWSSMTAASPEVTGWGASRPSGEDDRQIRGVGVLVELGGKRRVHPGKPL